MLARMGFVRGPAPPAVRYDTKRAVTKEKSGWGPGTAERVVALRVSMLGFPGENPVVYGGSPTCYSMRTGKVSCGDKFRR